MGNEIQRGNKRNSADPRMVVGILAGLYGLSPIDIIPDPLLGIGQIDDIGVIVLALMLMLFLTMIGGNRE